MWPRRVTETAYDGSEWSVSVSTTAQTSTARFLVDATGRGAALARAERRAVRKPRSAGRQRHAVRAGSGRRRRTADRNISRRLVVHGGAARQVGASSPRMSDADLVRPLGLDRPTGSCTRSARPAHVRRAMADARPLGSPALRPAGSRRIARDTTLPLLCVGDAASCFDPVSGQGIFKALRSGIFASYAIGDFLCRDDDERPRALSALRRRRIRRLSQDAARVLCNGAALGGRPFWQRRIESETSVSADAHNS